MSAAAAERLTFIPEEQSALQTEKRKVQLVLTKLHRMKPATRPKRLADRAQYDELLRTIADLEGEGLPRFMGVSFEDVTSLLGKPGLAALDRRLAELDTERARLEESIARWPTPETTHPYRYVGPVDGHLHFDGSAHRYLEVGEVIDLTEDQAKAFGDRFVPTDAPVDSEPVADELMAG